jgi:hypothetical protein
MICPRCHVPMNHHADKPHPAEPDAMLAFYTCPRCGTGGCCPAPDTTVDT